MTPLDWPIPKTPCLMQRMGNIIIFQPSYSEFRYENKLAEVGNIATVWYFCRYSPFIIHRYYRYLKISDIGIIDPPLQVWTGFKVESESGIGVVLLGTFGSELLQMSRLKYVVLNLRRFIGQPRSTCWCQSLKSCSCFAGIYSPAGKSTPTEHPLSFTLRE